jgi:hypothetical protein
MSVCDQLGFTPPLRPSRQSRRRAWTDASRNAPDTADGLQGKCRVPGRTRHFRDQLVTKELREPAGAGHGFFGFCGQVLFLEATEPFFDGSSGSFLDGLENLVLLKIRLQRWSAAIKSAG